VDIAAMIAIRDPHARQCAKIKVPGAVRAELDCGAVLFACVRAPLCAPPGPEERMILERFGSEYEIYMRSSKRLIPRVW
jgi:hypothetical protein